MLLYSCAVTSIIFLLLQTLLNIIIYLLFHRFQVKSEILIWNIIYAGISTKPEPASITKQKTSVPRLEILEVQCTYMYYATTRLEVPTILSLAYGVTWEISTPCFIIVGGTRLFPLRLKGSMYACMQAQKTGFYSYNV